MKNSVDEKQNNKSKHERSEKLSLEDVTNGKLFASFEEMEEGIFGIMGIHDK